MVGWMAIGMVTTARKQLQVGRKPDPVEIR